LTIMYKHSVIVCVSICLWLICGALGCQGKPHPPEKPKVVSKKILVDPPQAPASMPTQKVEAKTEASIPVQEAENKAVLVPSKADVEMPPAALQTQGTIDAKDEERKQAAEMLASISPNLQVEAGAVGYDPKGKINPFMPLFSSEQASAEVTVSKKTMKIRRAPRTPLEKIELSQLKLVATVRAPSGNRALVEDASGKGYIIKRGTYVGMNSGSVVEITKDRVVVEEEVETTLGETNIQKRELKLQKAPGE
jgi:type IV pilus assembly protein PilP